MCNMTYVSVNIDMQGNGRLEGASWDPYDILFKLLLLLLD